MVSNKNLYNTLFPQYKSGILEDYEYKDNGLLLYNPKNSDVFYLTEEHTAFHIVNSSGQIQCLNGQDLSDVPFERFLRGMTSENILKPEKWTITEKENSFILRWSVDVSRRIDIANVNLEDDDEPYLNENEYQYFDGQECHYIESNKFPYSIELYFEAELSYLGKLIQRPSMAIYRPIYHPWCHLSHYIKALYSNEKGIYNISKVDSSMVNRLCY